MPEMMPPAEDYPAAHSMDSCWFGVDADGHIAQFDTGERGLMPLAPLAWPPGASRSDTPDWKELHQLTDRADQVLTECGFFCDGVEERGHRFAGECRDGRIEAVETGGRRRYDRHELVDPRIDPESTIDGEPCQDPEFRGLFGVYLYRDSERNQMAYERLAVPMVPRTIDDLPEALREVMVFVPLPKLRFADTVALMAPEHCTDGSAYNNYEFYVSWDGATVRAMPGREQEFRDLFQTTLLQLPIGRARELRPDWV